MSCLNKCECETVGTSGVGCSLHDQANNNTLCTNESKRMDNALSPKKVCFLCEEKVLADPDCKVCHNIALYREKNDGQHANGLDHEDVKVNVCFPGPGIVKRNHIYGNYVVASRTIEKGELVIQEQPLTLGPYAPSESLPVCLSCFKDIGLSSKCSRCKWPVCGKECEKFYLHAENECDIFAKCGIKSKGVLSEYFSVETIRALLLRKKNEHAWKRVLEFEPHKDGRSNDSRAKATTDFIINFIRNKCNLADEFSPDVIDHVVGILSVNTFWAFKELNLYASCLFDKCTLLAHDCDPNTERKMILLEEEDNKDTSDATSNCAKSISQIALHITASRRINAGEMITIRYIDITQPLAYRREELKETFYFDCTCSRCLNEMSQESQASQQALLEAKLEEITLG